MDPDKIDQAVQKLMKSRVRMIFETVDEVRETLGINKIASDAMAVALIVAIYDSPIKATADMEVKTILERLVENEKDPNGVEGP